MKRKCWSYALVNFGFSYCLETREAEFLLGWNVVERHIIEWNVYANLLKYDSRRLQEHTYEPIA